MKILFITSSRLGDAVLSTGALDALVRANPDAKVTIVCGALPASLFEGMANCERVIILRKRSHNRHWIDLWRQVAPRRWDVVVDFRDSIVSRFIFARRRLILSGHAADAYAAKKLHKVEQAGRLLRLDPPPGPVIFVSERQAVRAKELVPDGDPVLAIGPTANWIGKTWPAERFIEVIRRLTAQDGPMPDARVAVFAAPGEEAVARSVLDSVPLERRIDMIARCDPGTAAAALRRCRLYIGNDSGLMHCAAASGIPTLGLFGPSWPYLYRPWGTRAAYVATVEDFSRLTAYEGYSPRTLKHSLMTGLSVDTVIAAAESLLR